MNKFWHDYVKRKHAENAKLYYADTDSFIVYIKTDNIYKDVPEMLKQDLSLQTMN